MNNKKSKVIALATAALTVVGSGASLNAAMSEAQVDALVKEQTGLGNTVSFVASLLGNKTYAELLNYVDDNGYVDLRQFSDEEKKNIKRELGELGYSWSKGVDGRISLTKDGQTITADQIQAQLREIKNYKEQYMEQASTSGGSSFVIVSGSGSGSTSTTSTQTSTPEAKLTEALVTKTVTVTKAQADKGINVGEQLGGVINSTTNKAVIFESKDEKNNTVATWCVETKDIKDKVAAQNFTMKTGVEISSVEATKANIPADVKAAATGKNAKVINFEEKDGTKLPFRAQTKLNVGTELAKKLVDVYYIVNGVSYPCGTCKVDAKGQVICNFEIIGDFVIIPQ